MEFILLYLLSQEESPSYQGKFRKNQQLVQVHIDVEQFIGQVQKKYKLVHNTLPIYQVNQVSFGQR